jgi:hypothetical protein
MTASQSFGRFAIPFRVPLLFSPQKAWVTAAETSSGEGKRCPHMGSFNLGNKSKFGGLMSGLFGAFGNTSHSYLLGKSVNLPQVQACIVVQNEWPIPEKARSVFVHFSAQVLHPVTKIDCCHTCSIWDSFSPWHTCFIWVSSCSQSSCIPVNTVLTKNTVITTFNSLSYMESRVWKVQMLLKSVCGMGGTA